MSFCIWLEGAGLGEGSAEKAGSWRRRRCDKETRGSRAVKIVIEGEARLVDGSGLMLSQELAYYVTEMPAEQLKRKVTLMRMILITRYSHWRVKSHSRPSQESGVSRRPPPFHQHFTLSTWTPLKGSFCVFAIIYELVLKIWWLLLLLWRISWYGGLLGGHWAGHLVFLNKLIWN